MSAGITGVAAVAAGRTVPNDEFAAIQLTDEWIRRRTGISSRTWFDDDAPLDVLAAEPCRALGRQAQQPVGALLLSSTSSLARVPGLAQRVATGAELGDSVLALDTHAACSGFVYTLRCALALVDSGAVPSAIVCCTEAMSRVVDRADTQTAPLFGDACVAVLVEARDDLAPATHLAGCNGAEHALMREGEQGGIVLDGLAVYDNAVRRMVGMAEELVAREPRPTVIVPHQANGRIIEQVRAYAESWGIPLVNRIATTANTSSASIPLAFSLEIADGAVPSTGRLAAIAYGAGESWGAVSVGYTLPPTAANRS